MNKEFLEEIARNRLHIAIQASEISLSIRDQHAFVEALLEPPAPSEALLKLQNNKLSR